MKENFVSEKDFERFFTEATFKSDHKSLAECLNHFILAHASVIACSFQSLPESIPPDFLSSLHLHLWTCSEHLQQQDYNHHLTHLCNLILKTIIILARNTGTVKAVSTDEFLETNFVIFETLIKRAPAGCEEADEFKGLFLYFLECLYDPCFFWRQTIHRLNTQTHGERGGVKAAEGRKDGGDGNIRQIGGGGGAGGGGGGGGGGVGGGGGGGGGGAGGGGSGGARSARWRGSQDCGLLLPSPTHAHFIPLFYDCLNNEELHIKHRIHVVSLFLASIHGSPLNAVKVICPASIDAILKLILKIASTTHLSSLPSPSAASSFPAFRRPSSVSSPSSPASSPSSSSSSSSPLADLFSVLTGSISVLIWKVHSFAPDKRQVEVPFILEGVWEIVNQLSRHDNQSSVAIVALLDQLRTTVAHNRVGLQRLFVHCHCLTHVASLLQNQQHSEPVLLSCLRLLFHLFKDSCLNKELFVATVGYNTLHQLVLKSAPLTKRVVEALYDLAIEVEVVKHDSFIGLNSKVHNINNVHIILLLLRLLVAPMQADVQATTSSLLFHLTTSSTHNRILCSQHDVVEVTLDLFQHTASELDIKILSDLLDLFESVASMHMGVNSVKKVMRLLRSFRLNPPSPWFKKRFLKAVCKVAGSKEAGKCQLTYWSFKHPRSYIRLEEVGGSLGGGLCVLAWVSFNLHPPYHNHFDIFTVTSPNGSLSLRTTTEGCLKVLMSHKKVKQEMVVADCSVADEAWHLVSVTHLPGKRPFGHNQVSVHVDTVCHLHTTTSLPVLSELSCFQIGSQLFSGNTATANNNNNAATTNNDSSHNQSSSPKQPPAALWQRLVPSSYFRSKSREVESEEQEDNNDENDYSDFNNNLNNNKNINKGKSMQSRPLLVGKVVEVLLFAEVLTPSQLECLYKTGIDLGSRMNVENEVLMSLYSKPLVWLNAKASGQGVCSDLSRSGKEATLSARVLHISHMKNIFNSIGGMQMILCLLDQSCLPPSSSSSSSSSSPPEGVCMEEWVELLRVLMQGQAGNQEAFIKCHGMPVLGNILAKLDARLITKYLFLSLQNLFKTLTLNCNMSNNNDINNNNNNLNNNNNNNVSNTENLQNPLALQMLEFVLLNFKIWSRAEDLNVVLDVLDLLQRSASKNRLFFRQHFGVQFLLDVVHLYFRDSMSREGEIVKKVRGACCSCMKLYVGKEVHNGELNQLLNALCVCQASFALDIMDVLSSLLEASGRNDQVFLLLFEPSKVECLPSFMVSARHDVAFKEELVKVIETLLKTTRVSEANKLPLRLLEGDCYYGFVHHMIETRDISDVIAEHLIDQSLANDSSPHFHNLLATFDLLSSLAPLSTKNNCLQKVLLGLLSKPSLARNIRQLSGWSGCLVQLLVDRKVTTKPRVLAERKMTTSLERNDSTRSSFLSRSSFDDPYASNSSFFSSLFSTLDEEATTTQTHSSTTTSPTTAIASPFSTPIKSFLKASKSTSPTLYDLSFVLKSLSLTLLTTAGPVYESADELVLRVLVLMYAVVWRCSDDALVDDETWQIRFQTLSDLASLETNMQPLITDPVQVMRRFYELLTLAAYNDMSQVPISSHKNVARNSVRLLEGLYHFLSRQPSRHKFSQQLLDHSMELMTAVSLLVARDNEDRERVQLLQLFILLLFIEETAEPSSQQAVIQLHQLLHNDFITQDVSTSCYVIATLNKAFNTAESSEWRNVSTQLMETLLDKSKQLLQLSSCLPHLPSNFFNNFSAFQRSQQWNIFIEKQVQPKYLQFKLQHVDSMVCRVASLLEERQEEAVVLEHRISRRKQEAIIKFQKDYLDCMKTREGEEQTRHRVVKGKLKVEATTTEAQWKSLKKNLSEVPGDQATEPLAVAECENDLRMRPKLVPAEVQGALYNLQKAPIADHTKALTELKSLEVDRLKAVASAAEEQLDEDDWSVISNNDLPSPSSLEQRELGAVMSVECELVTLCEKIKGRLDITSSTLIFTSSKPGTSSDLSCIKLPLEQLREMHFRRHNLRWSALEFFLVNHRNYFLNFDKTNRKKVYTRIVRLRPSNLINYTSRSPAELVKASGYTQKWVNREISNFEYLMRLNTISGRTYNDLSQYPVFPWILSDYTSERLDLEDPGVYRDLKWPIGANNSKNRELIKKKYESALESSADPSDLFHYGTHYSNPAGVMHYLLRLEPFTSLHVQLQDGTFDLMDRQFHSIPSTWQTLCNNPNDVKELTPEFFYMPEFLINHNAIDLGAQTQGSTTFGDVILPTWAHSPYHFIHQHREALESDHVSSNLHHWIDLIFGYKQQGQAAVEALNVFYYCSYEGAVDLEAEKDEKRRQVFEDIINNFGQAPSQLFKEAHPRRQTKAEWLKNMGKTDRTISVFECLHKLKENTIQTSPPQHPSILISLLSNPSLIPSSILQPWNTDTLVCVTNTGFLALHNWGSYDKTNTDNFTFNQNTNLSNDKLQRRLYSTSNHQPLPINSQLMCMSPDGRLILSVGYWDNSLRVYNVVKAKQTAHLAHHTDLVTCVSMDGSGRRAITGSRDSTCMVWQVLFKGTKSDSLSPSPLIILHGHSAAITSLSLSWQLDIVVSASQDGPIFVHSLNKGFLQRTLTPPRYNHMRPVVERLVLSCMGYVCVYCHHTNEGDEGEISGEDGGGEEGKSGEDEGGGGGKSGEDGGGRESGETTFQTEDDSRSEAQDLFTLHLYSINGKHLSREQLPSPVTEMVTCDWFLLVGLQSGALIVKELPSFKTALEHHLKYPINCIALSHNRSHVLVSLNDSSTAVLSVSRGSG